MSVTVELDLTYLHISIASALLRRLSSVRYTGDGEINGLQQILHVKVLHNDAPLLP